MTDSHRMSKLNISFGYVFYETCVQMKKLAGNFSQKTFESISIKLMKICCNEHFDLYLESIKKSIKDKMNF